LSDLLDGYGDKAVTPQRCSVTVYPRELMNLQQLLIVREIIRCKFNVTDAASSLLASQSSVSKQIKELEDELGSSIFQRRGKRLLGLTELGENVARIGERMLFDADNIRQAAAQFAVNDRGTLEIATTHTQARYLLPSVVMKFRQSFPNVSLVLKQANSTDIASLLINGKADIGIATDVLEGAEDILSFPYYTWRHIVIAAAGHPLEGRYDVSVEELANYPIITYVPGITGRPHIDRAFEEANVIPDITMTALDADVIKTYVEAGVGIGIIAPMAFDAAKDSALRIIDCAKIFPSSTTSIAIRRDRLQRNYIYRFIEMCAPALTEDVIRDAEIGLKESV
jgi:LysR family cys regulon transcriptional activator